ALGGVIRGSVRGGLAGVVPGGVGRGGRGIAGILVDGPGGGAVRGFVRGCRGACLTVFRAAGHRVADEGADGDREDDDRRGQDGLHPGRASRRRPVRTVVVVVVGHGLCPFRALSGRFWLDLNS